MGSGCSAPTWKRAGIVAAGSAMLLAGLLIGCSSRTTQPAPDGVPSWANPVEPACQPWTGGGPEDPGYPEHQTQPDWSSRGFIVYSDLGVIGVTPWSYTTDTSLAGIWVVEPRSGERQRIWPRGRDPRWSPDGEQIVFVDGSQICTINRRGGEFRQLTAGGWNNHPAWSPDGALIAFDSNIEVSAGFAIRLLQLDTLEQRRITGGGIVEPEWMPDGAHLVHRRAIGNSGQFCSMDTSGESVTALSDFPPGVVAMHARISPDGHHIAYAKRVLGACRSQLWILDVESGVDYRLTWEGGDYPAWSPDGTLLVYEKADYTQFNDRLGTLWLFNTMTGAETQLTHRWTPAKAVAR